MFTGTFISVDSRLDRSTEAIHQIPNMQQRIKAVITEAPMMNGVRRSRRLSKSFSMFFLHVSVPPRGLLYVFLFSLMSLTWVSDLPMMPRLTASDQHAQHWVRCVGVKFFFK